MQDGNFGVLDFLRVLPILCPFMYVHASSLHDQSSEVIHLAMISNREAGAGAALESVCKNAGTPDRLHFHMIGQFSETDNTWWLHKFAKSCEQRAATVSLYVLDNVVENVKQAGYALPWAEEGQGSVGRYSVFPATWDNSTVHNSPFNLLRFYIAHIEPFSSLSTLLFLDDDIIVQQDVAKIWNLDLMGGKVMAASCHNWVRMGCDQLVPSFSLSYLDVPYLGLGTTMGGGNATPSAESGSDMFCGKNKHRECIPKGIFEFLENTSRNINGREHAITIETLRQAKAFNYGLNKFNLDAWRDQDITGKYAKWMAWNRKFMVFPKTSISYGLGIAMLTKVGRVQCFDIDLPVVQGLGFVGAKDMTKQMLKNSFALHFNGPLKPWDAQADNPYSEFYMAYAPESIREALLSATNSYAKQRRIRMKQNRTSFVVLTHPRSGDDWFLEMLDRHEDLCAAGEAEGVSLAYPRDSLLPFSAVGGNEDNKQTKLMQIEASRFEQSSSHKMKLGKVGVPPTSYTSTPPDFEGYDQQTCQMRARCSWQMLSQLVWKASDHNHYCADKPADPAKHSEVHGFGPHLSEVCRILRRAWWRASKGVKNAKVKRSALVAEAFRVFFYYQMREQFKPSSNQSLQAEKPSLLPCRCPTSSSVMGQKVMHDWFVQSTENNTSDNAKPADMAHAPRYDFVSAMQEVGTKVLVLERKNILARFLPLDTVNFEEQLSAKHVVNLDQLKRYAHTSRLLEQKNLQALEAEGIPYLRIDYETCRKGPTECLELVSSFLKVRGGTTLAADSTTQRLLASVEGEGNAMDQKAATLKDHIANAEEVRAYLRQIGREEWLDSHV